MSPRVLLLEDDADVAFLSESVLREAGFEVDVAATVDAALKMCDRATPDIAVVDVQLPFADGWEFVRAIREGTRCPTMRVAIHSVHSDDAETAQSAERWRVDAVLGKTGDLDALVRSVSELLS